jgi:hypothetical protein
MPVERVPTPKTLTAPLRQRFLKPRSGAVLDHFEGRYQLKKNEFATAYKFDSGDILLCVAKRRFTDQTRWQRTTRVSKSKLPFYSSILSGL